MPGPMDVPPEPNTERPASPLRWVPIAVLGAGLALFFALGLDRYVSFAALSEHREWLTDQIAAHRVLSALVFIAIYALVVAFSIPGAAAVTIAAGCLFGTWPATLYVWVGATLGATALFLAARTALGNVLRAKAGSALQRMEQGFRKDALSYLLVLRLVPLFPFWLVNLVPAFLGVPLWTYVVATALGIIPGTFVYASVGNGLGALLDAGGVPDLSVIYSPEILTPICGLALLALVPVVYKRLRARRGKPG
jgi:uncharacterized membrane protein YdjX (TVP38/TMEM64 family)